MVTMSHGSRKDVVTPPQRKLVIPGMKKEADQDQVNLMQILSNVMMAIDRTSLQAEFQSLLDVYDRNAHLIYSVVKSSTSGELTVDDLLARGGSKFDFMYNTLLPKEQQDDSGFAAKINKVGRDYILSLFKMYIAVDKEDAEALKKAYLDYNEAYKGIFEIFVDINKQNRLKEMERAKAAKEEASKTNQDTVKPEVVTNTEVGTPEPITTTDKTE